MNPQIVPKKGKRGRHRWLAQDAAFNNVTVAMSPRDWETAEAAAVAGEELLEARAKPLREKIARLEGVARENRQAYRALSEANSTLERELKIVEQARDLARIDRKRDKRAVIIAYTIVFAAILVGVACIALNGIFCGG